MRLWPATIRFRAVPDTGIAAEGLGRMESVHATGAGPHRHDPHRHELIKTGLHQMTDGLLCLGASQDDSLVFRGPIT